MNEGDAILGILANDMLRYDQLAERDEERMLSDLFESGAHQLLSISNEHYGLKDKENLVSADSHPTHRHVSLATPRQPSPKRVDHQQDQTHRFQHVSEQDTDHFIKENLNKNTIYKTKSDIKIFSDWASSVRETRALEVIPPSELDGLLARFYLEKTATLINTVWLNNGVYFGLRGRQDHVNLMWGDMELKHTSEDRKYLEFNQRSTKTRNGSKAGDYRQVTPKMFAKPGDENCPVLMYKEYSSHRPTDLLQPESRFYLKPLAAPKGPVWYFHQPMGKDKLGKMMNTLAEKGQLEGRKVNHSTRKTFATTLVQAGLQPTEIAHLGCWKNIQSMNEYSAPSVGQQAIASDLISDVMLPSNTDHLNEVVVQEISEQDLLK